MDYIDLESATEYKDKLLETSRLGFIRKVYLILSSQLLLTVLICMLSIFNNAFLKFQIENIWLFYVTMAITIVSMILLVCVPSVARQVPNNYIILLVFTIGESYMVSVICGLSEGKLVLMAALMTLGITLALTIYAMTTKRDFTTMGGTLWVIGCGLLLFSIFGLFTDNNLFHILLSTAFVILYGIYLVYDTQLIVGGGKHELDLDDYVLGSLFLYIDIITLFIEILEILNRK